MRSFLLTLFTLTISLLFPQVAKCQAAAPALQAGQAIVDITPAVGTQLGGYLDPKSQRLVKGVRQPATARCLVLRVRNSYAAIVSLDMLAVGGKMAGQIRTAVSQRTGIAKDNICICATHTHSMPTLKPLRFYGSPPPKYSRQVIKAIVKGLDQAKADLSPAQLFVGTARAPGANFNRTFKSWKTDDEFTKQSTDDDRWLDSTVQVLHFKRPDKKDLLWYHFSAHPVCYRDSPNCGPDFDGHVSKLVKQHFDITPSFLQGHCGDVNTGDGKSFLGDADKVSHIVFAAIKKAMKEAREITVSQMQMVRTSFAVPYDKMLWNEWITHYEKNKGNKEGLGRGWFNREFARDWYASVDKWDDKQTHFAMPVSVLRFGDVALLFHAAELYSYYGLAIRRDSPFKHTIVVGYTDDLVGYLADPRAYTRNEYAAVAVPKVIDLPPFTPTAAREFTQFAVGLLKKVAEQ